jgi:hypothetical protein
LDAWRNAVTRELDDEEFGGFEWFGLFLFLQTLESLPDALLKWLKWSESGLGARVTASTGYTGTQSNVSDGT